MKKLLLLFFLVLALPMAANAQTKQCVIKGRLSSGRTDTLRVVSISKSYPLSQIVLMKNGEFSFTLPVDEPYMVSIGDDHTGGKVFFVEPGTIFFNGVKNLHEANIHSSAPNSLNNQLADLEQRITHANGGSILAIQDSLAAAMKRKDRVKVEELKERVEKGEALMKAEIISFIRQHPSSHASAFLLPAIYDKKNPEESLALFKSLSLEVQTSDLGQHFMSLTVPKNTIAVGFKAPAFALDHNNRKLTLDQFRGKVVLLEFWASWCAPCLKDMPELIKIADSHKRQGFEVLAISLDVDDEKMQKAMDKYQMPFIHYTDLKGWYSHLAEKYNVNAIPYNFLIDQEGNIAAINVKGAELTEKLASLLK
ncbi:AhpC/TSA family protein [Pontibacter amylolyticus]|nr:AhpC/TSA family protein [Pontibacter amylolyticus]